jgi:hypothetical protein
VRWLLAVLAPSVSGWWDGVVSMVASISDISLPEAVVIAGLVIAAGLLTWGRERSRRKSIERYLQLAKAGTELVDVGRDGASVELRIAAVQVATPPAAAPEAGDR